MGIDIPSSGRGAVKDPSTDRRLTGNKVLPPKEPVVRGGGQGRVKDPSTDRRLKRERDGGTDIIV